MTLYQLERQKLISQETIDVGEDVEKGEPSHTIGGKAAGAATP